MKISLLSVSLLLTLTQLVLPIVPGVLAQRNENPETYYRAPSSMHGKTVLIPVGTTFEGRIDSTIGSSVSQTGERFTITMASPVLANGVDVIIPAGSQIQGEVVEAIPAKSFPHQKGMPKPTGKLRVQLTGLKTPDGLSYPMVASLTGETIIMGRKVMANPGLGGGVGYMGTAAGFEAVAPGMADRYRGRGGRGPTVVSPQQLMRDPLYGAMAGINPMMRTGMGQPTIRALVKRECDLYIDAGSPLSVKLDAPFKIGMAQTGTAGEALGDLDIGAGSGESGRRFSRTKSGARGEQSQPTENYPGNTTGSAPGDSNRGGNIPPDNGQQMPSPQASPSPIAPPVNNSPTQVAPSQDTSF